MSVQFRVTLPCNWGLEINAETCTEGHETVWRYEFDGSQLLRGFRWYALAGNLMTEVVPAGEADRKRHGVKHVLVTPEWNVVDGGLQPSDALRIAKQVIADYDRIFGIHMLDYLWVDPAIGAIPGHQYVFLVPYPARATRGAGGYHAPGSGMVYIFFSRHDDPDDPRWISHTGGHEYFHIYNDSALWNSADANSWFVEGYTEGQATLRDLQHVDPQVAAQRYKLEMATQWVLMQNVERDALQSLRDEGLLVPPPRRIPRPDVPLESARRGDVRDWSRLVRGRSFLLIHVMALIFESAQPYRVGFDQWFRKLFDTIGWDKNLDGNDPDGPMMRQPIPTYHQFRQAGLDSAEAAAPMLDVLLSRYIERTEEFTLDDLKHWIRWAEDESLFDTLFATRK